MDRTTVLLVGGPFDGQRVVVDTDVPFVLMEQRLFSNLVRGNSLAFFVPHRYRRQTFTEGEAVYQVYVHSSVRDGDLLRTLIAGYTRKSGG